MVADTNEDIDVIGLADDELEASVQVFYVRKGRVVGRNGFVLDKVEELTPWPTRRPHPRAPLRRRPAPGRARSRCSVPVEPEDQALYEEWLTLWPSSRGSNVRIRVPQRGDRRALLETVTNNAKEEFNRHRLRRAGDLDSRSRALNELQKHLDLPEAPLRIEAYDMAHLQGTDYVGSMVVLQDGLPDKREYRRFKVNVAGQRRLRGDGGGAHPPADRLPRVDG